MITVRTYRAADGTRKMTVTGHAGFAEKGKDIVCAAVSALVETLTQYLDKVKSEGGTVRYRETTADGDVAVEVLPTAKAAEKVNAVWDAIYDGICSTARVYGRNVTVWTEEVSPPHGGETLAASRQAAISY